MLVVHAEVWPHGDYEKRYPLGVVLVANDGHVPGYDQDLYEYRVQLQGSENPQELRVWHHRDRGWLRLVHEVFRALS